MAILNDTHIGEAQADGHAHPENLRTAIRQILAIEPRPAAVIVNGGRPPPVAQDGSRRRSANSLRRLSSRLRRGAQ